MVLIRIEFYGDAVLKYLASKAVFVSDPQANPGQLTILRTKLINNQVLGQCAKQSGLTSFLRAHPIARGLEELISFPPGHDAARSLRNHNIQAQSATPVQTANANEKLEDSGKILADLVEAVLGAIYLHSQSDLAALSFLHKIGLFPSALATGALDPKAKASDLVGLSSLEQTKIEEMLGYQFCCPDLLSMALTHASFITFTMMSYERLEFLGDAVLDLCVAQHIFPDRNMYPGPGDLTKEKETRTCNRKLCAVAKRLGLQDYIQHKVLNLFAHDSDDNSDDRAEGNVEDDDDESEQSDEDVSNAIGKRPVGKKVLADVLEALIGAVFLDCGGSFEIADQLVIRLGISSPDRTDMNTYDLTSAESSESISLDHL